MNHTSSNNPRIQNLLEKCHELLAYKEIVLCWIHNHIGIQGNELVDREAKTSLSLEPMSFRFNFLNHVCFIFVSDHNTDSLMLYSVQLKNMYSYLNSSLKLSDIVRGLSCQQSYCN